jgi:hypothetical protein
MSKFSNVVLTLSPNPFEYIEKISDPIENLSYKKVIIKRLHLTHVSYGHMQGEPKSSLKFKTYFNVL